MFCDHDTIRTLVNAGTLWFVGQSALSLLGASRFLQLYVGGGVVAAACQAFTPLLVEKFQLHPNLQVSPFYPTTGASGAVVSLITWIILLDPTRTFLLYFIVPVPAAILGVLFVGRDVWALATGSPLPLIGGSPSHLGQSLGGTLFGAAFFMLTRRRYF
ncbi:unnamed protein product [Discosporangium mesarthrocarpum]